MRVLGQPQLQPLRAGIGAQQSVQGRGAGARQAGDEDRPLDRDVGMVREPLQRVDREQPPDEPAAQEGALQVVAFRREPGEVRVVVEQDPQALLVDRLAEVVQPDRLRSRRMQVLVRADRLTLSRRERHP